VSTSVPLPSSAPPASSISAPSSSQAVTASVPDTESHFPFFDFDKALMNLDNIYGPDINFQNESY
jgi:hypothetical protein